MDARAVLEIDATPQAFQPRDMNIETTENSRHHSSRLAFACAAVTAATFMFSSAVSHGAEPKSDAAWRSLPLITDGKVDTNWIHVGWGGFIVDEGVLRTEPSPKGLGLLVYQKERLGNCQIRVVFKA
jgi:hypothetical protein